jgi:cytochrome d ubiquinol oxidase subunit II
MWDAAIFAGSLVPALLFGVAFGNIFSGLPMDAEGYHGSLASLLNPYGIVTGVLFVLLFAEHGALYLSVKTVGGLRMRAVAAAKGIWPALLAVAVVFLAMTGFSTKLYDNFFAVPALFSIPLGAVAALFCIRLYAGGGKMHRAFAASCITIVLVVVTGIAGLFPNLIPSSLDPASSLTIYNSSSSGYTLKIMTAVALIFVPVVIAYKIWVYRVFRGAVTVEEVQSDEHSY